MYLTIFLDANRYEFVTSLHLNLAAAEAAYEDLLREFVLEDGEPLPPKADWHAACDRCGEYSAHLSKSKVTANSVRKSFSAIAKSLPRK